MPPSTLTASDQKALAALAGDSIRFDEPMRRHTTLKVGGPCDAWFEPADSSILAAALRHCSQNGIPVTPIGAGSNLLVRDGGIRGVVVSTRQLRAVRRENENTVYVESGVSTGKLLATATRWQLGGVEFLGGVPGSVGGGLVMNAGTYLGEFVDVTHDVTSMTIENGARVERSSQQCGFGYRTSKLPRDEIVVGAKLVLRQRDSGAIIADVRSLKARRKAREPTGVHNAGSAFKNPKNDFAGRLIEACALKGMRIGDAECSHVHANWFVNRGQASAAEMLQLLELAHTRVKEQHGIDLQLEWKLLGAPK